MMEKLLEQISFEAPYGDDSRLGKRRRTLCPYAAASAMCFGS